jgi:hypothetical protein
MSKEKNSSDTLKQLISAEVFKGSAAGTALISNELTKHSQHLNPA